MCATCGCSDNSKVTITDPANGRPVLLSHTEAHAHGVAHDHGHGHGHHHHPSDSSVAAVTAHAHKTTIELEKEILGKNQLLAERNRGWLAGRGILALNLVSSPG